MKLPKLRDHITRAIDSAGIEGFSFVGLTKWEPILHRIAERFLKCGVRDLRCIWIWNEFREDVSTHQPPPELALDYLREQLEPSTIYWFLASEQGGKYWVAESTGGAAVRMIAEMHYFEYYIVDRHLEWILCENHHGIFIRTVAGKPEEQTTSE